MTNQDLAEFYGISSQAVGRWSKERKQRKTIQALANAEQSIVDLIADINKLAYIYDCQWLHGVEQKRWCWINRSSVMLVCYLYQKEEMHPQAEWTANLHATDVVAQLKVIKTKLEGLVYGVSSFD